MYNPPSQERRQAAAQLLSDLKQQFLSLDKSERDIVSSSITNQELVNA